MNEIEKKLYHDLKADIEIPVKYENAIKEGLNNKKRHYSLAKILSTACAGLLITTGIVCATTNIYDKIWKEPKKIVGYSIENSITEDELKGTISEIEARKKAEEILRKFGYNSEKIKSINLEKNNDSLDWYIETENQISLYFDAKNGKGLYLFSNSILDKNIEQYHTTKSEAEQTIRDLCEKIGYDLSEYSYMKIDSNMESEDESYIWYVNFYKKYDGLVDEYSGISIAFIPQINELYYFVVREGNYENNPVVITEEQAKEIALKEEQKIDTKYKIKDSKVELSIISMNGDAYERVTDYKQFCEERNTLDYPNEKQVEYRTESRIRKAWKVRIDYDAEISDMFTETFNVTDVGYIYFIDATTGEVIGGEASNNPVIVKND